MIVSPLDTSTVLASISDEGNEAGKTMKQEQML